MKKKYILAICLLMTVFVTSCSNNNSTENTSSTNSISKTNSKETKTVKDMKGEVEIPTEPNRIVDVSGSADELIIMGIPFIASANTSMFDGTTVPDYLQEYFTENNVEIVGNYSGIMDLNLEKIASLKPDLIIMNIRHDKIYDQLQNIAPTIMIDDDVNYVDWKGRFEQLGKWFNKEDITSEWLKKYDDKAMEYSHKIKEKIGDETFAIIEANSVHFGSYYVYRNGGPGDLIFNAMNLPPSQGVPENTWGEVVDAEYFSKIDADHIFFFSDDGTIGETKDNPSWQSLKAVKEGNIYYGINEMQ